MARKLIDRRILWIILAFGTAILAVSIISSTGVSAGGGDESKANAGKQVFAWGNYRFEVEPIEVKMSKGFPGRIKPGESAKMRFAIVNHSPSMDWVVAMKVEFDFSNVVPHSLGLGMEAGMFHGETGAVYHPGDPLVVPAGTTKEIVIRVTVHDGAGMVLVKNVSVYRLKPFVDGLG